MVRLPKPRSLPPLKGGGGATISGSLDSLVTINSLEKGRESPLIIKPRNPGLKLEHWIKDNLDRINRELLLHGGILFRGFDVGSIENFSGIIKTTSSSFASYKDQHTPRSRLIDGIYTSTDYPADHVVPFHSENSKNQTWPKKIWFYCASPPDQDGETPIADNRVVYRKLPENIREAFAKRNVLYRRNVGQHLGLPLNVIFQEADYETIQRNIESDGSIHLDHINDEHVRIEHVAQGVARHPETNEMVWFNQAHLFHVSGLPLDVAATLLETFGEMNLPSNAYFGDAECIPDEMLEAIRTTFDEVAVTFSWEQDDVLLLDNMLMSHGRRPYQGGRKIAVAMTEPFVPDQKIML